MPTRRINQLQDQYDRAVDRWRYWQMRERQYEYGTAKWKQATIAEQKWYTKASDLGRTLRDEITRTKTSAA